MIIAVLLILCVALFYILVIMGDSPKGSAGLPDGQILRAGIEGLFRV